MGSSVGNALKAPADAASMQGVLQSGGMGQQAQMLGAQNAAFGGSQQAKMLAEQNAGLLTPQQSMQQVASSIPNSGVENVDLSRTMIDRVSDFDFKGLSQDLSKAQEQNKMAAMSPVNTQASGVAPAAPAMIYGMPQGVSGAMQAIQGAGMPMGIMGGMNKPQGY
jgi:hypothetical protein